MALLFTVVPRETPAGRVSPKAESGFQKPDAPT